MLAVITWHNPLGGNWNDASNWDLGRLPNVNDDVVIPDLGVMGKNLTVAFESGTATVKSLSSAERLNVTGGSLTNRGNLSGSGSVDVNGGDLTFDSVGWSNLSTVNLASGRLFLGGSFTQSAVGTLQRTGGTVAIVGTLSGGLSLDASTGPWYLEQGTINGGTITTQGNNTLRGTDAGFGGYLHAVTIANGSTLDLTDQVSTINVSGGLTVDGTILLGNAAGTTYSRLRLTQTQTIGGTGKIQLGTHFLNGTFTHIQGPISFTFADSLTIRGPSGTFSGEGSGASNPTYNFNGPVFVETGGSGLRFSNDIGSLNTSGVVTVEPNSVFTAAPQIWNHAGALAAASNSTLNASNLVNTGSITTDGSTVNLAGAVTQYKLGAANPVVGQGTFSRAGGAVNLVGTLTGGLTLDETTGPWYLGGGAGTVGIILGGTITTKGNNTLRGMSFNGPDAILDGVTIAADSTVDYSEQSTYLSVKNGLTVNGTLFLGNNSGTTQSIVNLRNSMSIDGTGTILFGGNSLNGFSSQVAGTSSISFGSNLLLRGSHARFEGWGAGHTSIFINGPIDIQAGGHFNFRSSIGTVETNADITMANGSTLAVEPFSQWRNTGELICGDNSHVHARNLLNTGSLSIGTSTLHLSGNVTQSAVGTINRTSFGKIILEGTLTGALTLNSATGPWQTFNAIIDGAIISTHATAPLIVAGHNNSFRNGVIIASGSVVDMTGLVSGGGLLASEASVYGGMTIDGELLLGQYDPGGNTAALNFENTQTIDGSGSIVFGHSNSTRFTALQPGVSTITFGPNLTLRGRTLEFQDYGGASTRSYVVNGPLLLEPGGSGVIVRNTVTSFTINGSVTISPTTSLDVQSNVWTVGSDGVVFVDGGVLRASGTNLTNLDNGILAEGTWHIASGGNARLPSSIHTNRAKIIMDGPDSRIYQGATGTTEALATLTLNDTNGVLELRHGYALKPVQSVTNAGKVMVDSSSIWGSSIAPFGQSEYVQVAGTTTVDGSLRFENGATINGGKLEGRGRVDSHLVNNAGTVDPGNAMGNLSITGNYTQAQAGTLELQIGGTSAGINHDRLTVLGTASLSGTLRAILSDGYGPSPGYAYTVLASTSLSGGFSIVDVPSIAGAPAFAVDSTATDVNLIGSSTIPDLGVTSASPATNHVSPGQNLQVNYQVQNRGTVTASGSWNDRIYLSIDSHLSSDDLLLGTRNQVGPIVGLGQYNGSLSAPVPGLPDGSYRVIVVTDAGKQIPDSLRANNTFASPSPLAVRAQTLAIGTSVTANIVSGQEVYYRLNVPPGSNVEISAAFPGPMQGELLASYASMPTRSQFDFSGGDIVSTNPTVELPSGRGGVYYLLLRGREGAVTPQPYTLHADFVPLRLSDFSPKLGGNSGHVTIVVKGTGLSADATAMLRMGSTVIGAQQTSVQDGKSLSATFDLTGRPIGKYVLEVEQGASKLVASEQFEIKAPEPNLRVSIIPTPSPIRAGSGFGFLVEIENLGINDVVLPAFQGEGTSNVAKPLVRTVKGSILPAFNPDNRELSKTRFTVNFRPDPPSGGTTSTASIFPVLATAPVDWASIKASSRPVTVSTEAWDVIWENYEAAIGDSVDDMQAVLDANAAYFTSLGLPIPSTDQLLAFERSKANAEFPVAILDAAIDAAYPEPGLPLVFARSYVQSIAGRYRLGTLGRGWVSNWDFSVIADSNGVVHVQQGASVRRFVPLRDGSYTGLGLDTGNLSFASGRFILRETDGSSTAFLPDTRLDYIEDKYGTRITATYNDLVTTFTHSNGDSLILNHNANGRLVQVTLPDSRVVTYAYDSSHQHLTAVVTPQGNQNYAYVSGQGAVREHALASSIDINGAKVQYAYDAKGRLISIDSGVAVTTYTHLVPGGYTIDSGSGPATIHVDINGRPVSIKDALDRSTQLRYDANGLVRMITAPDSQSTSTLSYDRFGNLTRTVDALSQSTQSTYDRNFRNLQSFRNQMGIPINFSYDSRGDLLKTIYEDGNFTSSSPGLQGQVEQSINARGQSVQYTYDSRGLLTSAVYPEETVSYTYDVHANLRTATNSQGTTTMDYDSADRLIRISYPDGKFLQYAYDTFGRRSEMTDHQGFKLSYSYDTFGRLSDMYDGGNSLIVSYTYDSNGRLSLKKMGNGTYTSYVYNADDSIQSIVNRAPRPSHSIDGAVNSRFDYTYDVNGRVKTMTTLDGVTTYGYDAIGQLTSAALPGGRNITYTYDAAGNRTQVTDSVRGTTVYFANSLDQYTSIGADTLSYDADGNLISRTGPSGTTSYSYDSRNRVIGVTTATDTWTYEYDVLGNRTTTNHNGQQVRYLVDPFGFGNVVGEFDETGNPIARYTHGLGLINRVEASGNSAYYDYDAQGSTSALTGPSGTNVYSYSYLPYGEESSTIDSLDNPFRFVGQAGIMQETNGLDYMRARFYSSTDGRFVTRDPIGILGGTNLYAYVSNDPANLIDPSGLVGEDDWLPLIGENGQIVPRNAEEAREIARALARIAEFDRLQAAKAAAAASTLAAFRQTALAYLTTAASRTLLGRGLYGVLAVEAAVVVTAVSSIGYAEYIGHLPTCADLGPLNFLNGNVIACDSTPVFDSNGVRIDNVSGSWLQVGPVDPNFISGTVGYGPQQHVTVDTTLPYTIEFENKPDATAPALVVTVTHQLDSDLDWATFELGDFKFGDYSVPVPSGKQHYSARVDATNTLNCFVDIVGNLDRSTGLVTWTYTTLDPVTFDIPLDDPLAGFLPPEDGFGKGLGSVSFFVASKPETTSGTLIEAQARIVFDTEAPIDTNIHFNTIDADVPNSSVNTLPPVTSTLSFSVSWSGTDAPGGSGIGTYDVYVSENDGPFQLWLQDTAQTSATFSGTEGHRYAFVSRARDLVGYFEPLRSSADTSTLVDVPLTVQLQNVTAQLYENASTASDIHLADIDVGGVPASGFSLALQGPDANRFQIVDQMLYLKSGVPLDALVQPNYSITITVDEIATTEVPDATLEYALQIQIVANVLSARPYYANSTFASGGDIAAAVDTSKAMARETSVSQSLSIDNLTNTTRGINGLIFDISRLPSSQLTASDFHFQWSPQGAFNQIDHPPIDWQSVPVAPAIDVLPGSVPRAVLTWPDQTIMNRWLRVTIQANANTGLSQDDVYYLGHLKGETTGAAADVFSVSYSLDLASIRLAMGTNVGPGSPNDVDKNGRIQFADVVAMRAGANQQLTQITIVTTNTSDKSLPEQSAPFSKTWRESDSNHQTNSLSLLSSKTVQSAAYAAAVDQALDDLYSPGTHRRRARK